MLDHDLGSFVNHLNFFGGDGQVLAVGQQWQTMSFGDLELGVHRLSPQSNL